MEKNNRLTLVPGTRTVLNMCDVVSHATDMFLERFPYHSFTIPLVLSIYGPISYQRSAS